MRDGQCDTISAYQFDYKLLLAKKKEYFNKNDEFRRNEEKDKSASLPLIWRGRKQRQEKRQHISTIQLFRISMNDSLGDKWRDWSFVCWEMRSALVGIAMMSKQGISSKKITLVDVMYLTIPNVRRNIWTTQTSQNASVHIINESCASNIQFQLRYSHISF